MKIKSAMILLVVLAIVWPSSILLAGENPSDTTTLLLAQSIRMKLGTIARSVKALGDAYLRAYEETPVMAEKDQQKWLARSFRDRQTVQFRPFTTGPEPAFQSPQPGYFYYHGTQLTPNAWRELNTFTRLAPLLVLTYKTFNDSWVYLTTKDGAFLVYPYLPLSEAVHNFPPTEQIFYTAADFKNRAPGWTPPYLDLAGAGMMVTVSYPVYRQSELLGVVARDVTLTQLANQTLEPVSASNRQLVCLLINRDGMAIANSQAEGMREINTVNTGAKAAVLYYREKKGAQKEAAAGIRLSASGLYNRAGQLALESARSAPEKTVWNFAVSDGADQYRGSATRIESTGWFVITLQP